MLREIEVSAMRWRDVTVNQQFKRITIFIPLSKCDQQGLGVRRALQCCMRKSCPRWCCWRVWNEIWKAYWGNERDPQEYIFQDSENKKLSDQGQDGGRLGTSSRTRYTGPFSQEIRGPCETGHAHTIQELAFVGWWKSSVVLTYAEDALQSNNQSQRTRASATTRQSRSRRSSRSRERSPLRTCRRK